MDDIAKALSVSKKTIYQIVNNKHHLIEEVIKQYLSDDEKELCNKVLREKDALGAMFLIIEHAIQIFRNSKSRAIYDLKNYYTDLWENLKNENRVQIMETIKDNLERGKKEGVYRKDLDEEIVASVFPLYTFSLLQNNIESNGAFSPDLEKKFTAFMDYHLHGICSEKGMARVLLNEIKLNSNNSLKNYNEAYQ